MEIVRINYTLPVITSLCITLIEYPLYTTSSTCRKGSGFIYALYAIIYSISSHISIYYHHLDNQKRNCPKRISMFPITDYFPPVSSNVYNSTS